MCVCCTNAKLWRRFNVVTVHCHCKGSGIVHLSLEMELNQIKYSIGKLILTCNYMLIL